MIDRFVARNYGCLRKISLELTPFHALIGPNDSGKSTILRGIHALGEIAVGKPSKATLATIVFGNPAVGALPIELEMKLGESKYHVTIAAGRPSHRLETPGATNTYDAGWGTPPAEPWKSVVSAVAGARIVRFDPDALREASGLVPQDKEVGFLDERGRGLPGVLQAVQGRDIDAFVRMRDQVRSLFPTIKEPRIAPVSTSQLVIEAELVDGTKVSAAQVSEGLLYFLAFASIPHVAPTPVLLVEEPENGLHPSRIATIVHMLREFGERSGTQIVLATHSPLVVNELQPEEVTLVTRPSVEVGTLVTPMSRTRNFEKRRSEYALGELWLSYADGKQESELVDSPQ